MISLCLSFLVSKLLLEIKNICGREGLGSIYSLLWIVLIFYLSARVVVTWRYLIRSLELKRFQLLTGGANTSRTNPKRAVDTGK